MNSKWYFTPWFRVLFIVVGIFSIAKGYEFVNKQAKRSKQFSFEKVRLKDGHEAVVPVTTEQVAEANRILSQPFFFLGNGRQCYAFESSDGKYVLKFFQQERFTVENYLTMLPDFLLIKKLRALKAKDKTFKLERLISSFQLAVEEAQDETGVFFAHLGSTHNVYQKVMLLDKRGTLQTVPLDKVQFVLQRKAALIKPTIMKLMFEAKEEEAKKRIEQIFTLLVSCARKGIQDTDGALIRNNNLGFLENVAIYIDTGKLIKTNQLRTRNGFEYDLRRLRPLYNWLRKSYPVLAEHFDECRSKALDQFS